MKIIKKQVNVKPQRFEVEIRTFNNLQIFIHLKKCFLPYTVLSQNTVDARMPILKFEPEDVLFRCT